MCTSKHTVNICELQLFPRLHLPNLVSGYRFQAPALVMSPCLCHAQDAFDHAARPLVRLHLLARRQPTVRSINSLPDQIIF